MVNINVLWKCLVLQYVCVTISARKSEGHSIKEFIQVKSLEFCCFFGSPLQMKASSQQFIKCMFTHENKDKHDFSTVITLVYLIP